MKRILFVILAMLLPPTSLNAQQTSPAQLEFFEANIRPALVKYCYKCHSVEAGDSRAGLLLDTRRGLLEGGDSGPAIVPGRPDESLLWEAINWDGYEMPPSQKMPRDVIDKFEQWIEMGAPDPRVQKALVHKTKITAEDIEEGKNHWAFQPPKSQASANIEKLVTAKLREAGLKPSDSADPFTLLRRINFDLIGLPPTPDEIQTFHTLFKNDPDAAVKAKVDELLSRPQYGERWGRHWLDVARYAESSGSRNIRYPHAWRYRNYVIDSFNDDTPYDRFVAEQIAGDLLPVKTDEQWQENLIATGFLAIGMKHHDERNPRKFMADMVDEQIDTMTQAVLGLTVSCARCHDHKYDPIPTDDYYALAGIFYSTKTFYGTIRVAQNHRPSELLILPIPDDVPVTERRSQQTIDNLKSRIAQLDREMMGMRGRDRRQISNVRNRIAGELASLNPDGTPKTFGMGVQDPDRMTNAKVLIGGEVDHPAQEVRRGFLQILGDLNFTVESSTSSGRLDLVESITSKENPLTARVMANRIWMHLLGKPLVTTPSNFGFSGMKPENQELLDYLAVRFMEENWSVKNMIREIVMSDTYRRSSAYDKANYRIDPDNKFLWRANPRQVDAEAMRDAMLTLAGRLDLVRPSASPVASGRMRPGALNSISNHTYRSIYLPIVRDGLPAALELFDFPDPNITSAGRSESIVPTQALYMMNSDFVTTQAQAMAVKLEQEYRTTGQQIRYAFAWAYGRPATQTELDASAQFFRTFKSDRPSAPAPDNTTQSQRRPDRRYLNQGAFGDRRPGRGGPGRARPRTKTVDREPAVNQTLAVFCQTLMASARFRILN